MFNVRNINRMERSYLDLLNYNTIISASQYAQYYFSLRHTVRAPSPRSDASGPSDDEARAADASAAHAPRVAPGRRGDNFRSKYFMAINVPSSARLQEQSAALANQLEAVAIPRARGQSNERRGDVDAGPSAALPPFALSTSV